MNRKHTPNTKIKAGQLKKSDLEKISCAYLDCGLEICGKSITDNVSIDSINENNLKLREFEITPQPLGRVDSKLYFFPRICSNGELYLDIKINPDDYAIKTIGSYKEIQEKFNKNLKKYFFY